KNHISYDEFIEICKKNGLTDSKNQEILAKTFHRIGVILHFGNEPELFNTVFLNHKWVVDSLYTILKDKYLRENNGLFTKLRMFDLCYKVGNGKTDKFLFPSVMPVEKHAFAQQWKPQDSLRFRLQYTFMPKGITTRLIVRLSEYIHSENNQNIVWRTGAMLKKGTTLALISEDVNNNGAKVIDVCLEGHEYEGRDFLIVIREELAKLHSSFSNLEVNEMVPCICRECKQKSVPHFFKYEQLDKRRKLRKLTIECEESSTFEEVDVMKLLEGVETLRIEDKKDLRDISINVNPTINPTINQNKNNDSIHE
ncbi:MAG: COR domain-containing protein, partial [Ignavibacteria bacterium]|nr:COR domain-containing protein [Ignavibacteria bacterium]